MSLTPAVKGRADVVAWTSLSFRFRDTVEAIMNADDYFVLPSWTTDMLATDRE